MGLLQIQDSGEELPTVPIVTPFLVNQAYG